MGGLVNDARGDSVGQGVDAVPEHPAVPNDGLNARVTLEDGTARAAKGIQLASDEGVEVLDEVGDAPSPVVGDQMVVGGDELELVELHPGLFAVAGGDDAETEVDDAANDGLGHKAKALMDAAAGHEDGGVRVEVPRAGHRRGEVGRQGGALHRGSLGSRQPDRGVQVAAALRGFARVRSVGAGVSWRNSIRVAKPQLLPEIGIC